MVKLTMEPVTRIEGHAKITVHLDDAGNVEDTRLHVMEFRGFEKFMQGRPVEEAPRIVPRICGICDVQHHLAALKLQTSATDSKMMKSCLQLTK
jgi:F420-non-reducing hydrogenase large subunit